MDTLRERLAEAANKAPTESAPAAELWARGKRAQRLRAAAVVATVLVVGGFGTGIGVRLAEGDGGDGSIVEPAGPVGISLPIEYPVGRELPDLGDAPGPLAAVWLVPRGAGAAPEAVGLVAETGTFGTLPIDLLAEPADPDNPDPLPLVSVSLSPDGRRIAYTPSGGAMMTVRDLVSGESESLRPEFGTRPGYTWVDATHLVGHVAGGSDSEAWAWEPGTAAKRVDYYTYLGALPRPYLGAPDTRYMEDEEDRDLGALISGGGPYSCSPPAFLGGTETGEVEVSVFCDVLYLGNQWLLGHWKDPREGNTAVVALDLRDFTIPPVDDFQFDEEALRRVVVTAGAPLEVSLATDLVGAALKEEGGAL